MASAQVEVGGHLYTTMAATKHKVLWHPDSVWPNLGRQNLPPPRIETISQSFKPTANVL
jgi:hypothetical protein